MPQKALIHDMVTQWGSTQNMLERFLSQQQPVFATLARERGTWHLMPKVMEELCQLLEPLSKFTDALASETRVTLLAIKPVLDHIIRDGLVEKDKKSSLTKEMKRVMREDLNNRYTEKAKRVVHMACFLEPGFKTSFSDEPEAATVDSCVQEALHKSGKNHKVPALTPPPPLPSPHWH